MIFGLLAAGSLLLLTVGLVHATDASDAAVLTDAKQPLVDRSLLLGFLATRSGLTLVDARSPEEYASRHIDGAVNVPHDQLDSHLSALPADRSGPVVVYCRTGKRAGLLQAELIGMGYTDVRVLPPRQMFWNDEVMVFNCGVSDPAAPPASPVAAQVPAARSGDQTGQ